MPGKNTICWNLYIPRTFVGPVLVNIQWSTKQVILNSKDLINQSPKERDEDHKYIVLEICSAMKKKVKVATNLNLH